MASMFNPRSSAVRLLDAGAGIGSLAAAFVAEMCSRELRPLSISVTAYELDPDLAEHLKKTLEACCEDCERDGVAFSWQVLQDDFVEAAVRSLQGDLFGEGGRLFNCVIMNPPYRKIGSGSRTRKLLASVGIEAGNLYAAFLSLAIRVLASEGELVAITPRSFCNGPYFRPFRKSLVESMHFQRLHVFESRELAFQDDQVLQENIVFHAIKTTAKTTDVVISSSVGPEDTETTFRAVRYDRLVKPGDPECFIHIAPEEVDDRLAERMERLETSLPQLGLTVSTGRVVEFRAKAFLRAEPSDKTVPLIYPAHFCEGFVRWPRPYIRKPNALLLAPETLGLVVPTGTYVLVKRFSSKEERRRIVAAIYDPARISTPFVGFENHLNYFHSNGHGIAPRLAKGLAIFLNSSLVDAYFRQFSGHTQVNATDLRNVRYPNRERLEGFGSRMGDVLPPQAVIDRYIEEELL